MKISLHIFPKMPDMRYGYALLGLDHSSGPVEFRHPWDSIRIEQ
jgi:hypothetical protein